ncbi:hypothetical protein [Plebeiibacterium sediminum]|uniref:VCBS repeat-containing protein n=1 Tax=Plebeiibacterium sediminum TaxID=2992112 RepID=A0AAE3SDT2_9BACT|nr:hypothetical protein [Plebeiobacterium sediminum]MCW3785758.1 hypothetical protein [Plebeiobacterium sediminum]
MRFRITFIFILFFIGNNIFSQNIPDHIIHFIEEKLPQLSKVSIDEYVAYWNDFMEEEGQLPYYCSGDFNGDNNKDYAILLTDSVKQLYLYSFLKNENSYKVILIDKLASQNEMIQIVVHIEPKGVWESIVDEINVSKEGVTIDLLDESLSWSYYFEDDKFIKFLYD